MAQTNLLCAFCGKHLDDDGIELEAEAEGQCPCCGPPYVKKLEVEIYCRNPECVKYNKVIYTKSEI